MVYQGTDQFQCFAGTSEHPTMGYHCHKHQYKSISKELLLYEEY